MWLAGRLRGDERQQETVLCESGRVTIGGDAAGVLCRGEERAVAVAAPGGYAWRPVSGERVLLIRGGTLGEERYIAGALSAQEQQTALEDGEVCLYSSAGGARIILRNSGMVEIEGDVYINGAPYIPPES